MLYFDRSNKLRHRLPKTNLIHKSLRETHLYRQWQRQPKIARLEPAIATNRSFPCRSRRSPSTPQDMRPEGSRSRHKAGVLCCKSINNPDNHPDLPEHCELFQKGATSRRAINLTRGKIVVGIRRESCSHRSLKENVRSGLRTLRSIMG